MKFKVLRTTRRSSALAQGSLSEQHVANEACLARSQLGSPLPWFCYSPSSPAPACVIFSFWWVFECQSAYLTACELNAVGYVFWAAEPL